jgi:predicted nucleic acid-binding protein
MKRLLIDVNVVLDAVLERGPQSGPAARLWGAAEAKQIDALIPAHGVTTLFYLLRNAKGSAFARRTVGSLVGVFGVAAVDGAVVARAVALGWPDFEDAVCAAAAEASGCEAIVTRDPKDFAGASLPVLAPETVAALMDQAPPDRVGEARRPTGQTTANARSNTRARRRTSGRVAAKRQTAAGGKKSSLDVVGDLVGSVSGPKDLSSNPRYLRGYGR